MDVDFAFLADYAMESGGKLNALGLGIDTLYAASLPATHPVMTLAARIRYSSAEAGDKELSVRMVDADGKNVIPPIDRGLSLGAPEGLTGTAQIVIQLLGVRFEAFGQYAVQLAIGGQSIANINLSVIERTAEP